jgi:hypothetical protein
MKSSMSAATTASLDTMSRGSCHGFDVYIVFSSFLFTPPAERSLRSQSPAAWPMHPKGPAAPPAHVAVGEARVDRLVHEYHVGVGVPAVLVVKQRHVVGEAVGAVLWGVGG